MGAPIVVEVPGAPRGKGRPRFRRVTGMTYTPKPTRDYEAALKKAGVEAMRGRDVLTGPVVVDIVATFAPAPSWSRRKTGLALIGDLMPTGKPDADNLAKVCDALNKVVWKDDAQIVRMSVAKVYGPVPGLRIEARAA